MRPRVRHTFLMPPEPDWNATVNNKIASLLMGLVCAHAAHATIYPAIQTLQPPVDLEVGEVALNTLLNAAFVKPYTLGSGATVINIQVRKMSADIEAGSVAVNFRSTVTYDLTGTPKSYDLSFSQTVPVASVTMTYSGVKKRVTMVLSGLAAALDATLPAYVKTALTNEFGQFSIYPNEVMQELGGPITAGTTQLQKSFSIVFRDDYKVTFSLQKDLLKLSVAPKWELEAFDFGLWLMGGGPYDFVGQFHFESNVPLQVTSPWIGDSYGHYQQYTDVIPLNPTTAQNGFPRYSNTMYYKSATGVSNNAILYFRANYNNQLTHFHTSDQYNGLNTNYVKKQLDNNTLTIK
jgi:hypothetical protein